MIEQTIASAERLVGRKLSGEEVLILGVAYQDGYLAGFKFGQKKEADSAEKTKRTGE